MMRLVAFGKAIRAGLLGALAWEAAARILIRGGLPLFDISRLAGTMIFPDAPPWQWWAAGAAMHLLAGAVWAVVYAYFFFYTFDCAPAVQGLLFAMLPCALAGLIMVPQMGLMSPRFHPGVFAVNYGWGGPSALVLGHAIYGLVMGAAYTRPVGHRAGRVAVHG